MSYVLTLVVILVVLFQSAVFILKEYERGVVLRLGRFTAIRGPGFVIIWPFIDKLLRVDLRIITYDIPSQDVITRDNVSVKVNGVLLFKIVEPDKAILQVENFFAATSQYAQTTLRSVCGEVELDDLLQKRVELNMKIQEIIDQKTHAFGVKVVTVEVKQVDLPQEMQRAMAKQAEAERLRRSKIIQAEGEFQASVKLTEAARVMSAESGSMQLRYLETLRDIGSEHNTTIIFPVPMDIFESMKKITAKQNEEA